MADHKGKLHGILKADVVSVKVATPEERRVFSDQKKGIFRTFELINGLKFVGRIDTDKKEFTFRPVHSPFEKMLEEVHYRPTDYYKGAVYSPPIYTCSISVTKTVTPLERKIYDEIFNPSNDFSRPEFFGVKFIQHPLCLKALEILSRTTKIKPDELAYGLMCQRKVR